MDLFNFTLDSYLIQLGVGGAIVAVLSVALMAYRHFSEASTLFYTDKKIHGGR